METQTWCRQKTALLKTHGSRTCVRVQQTIGQVSSRGREKHTQERSRSPGEKGRALANHLKWYHLLLMQRESEGRGRQHQKVQRKSNNNELDTAIRKEKSQAQKMNHESAKGLLSTETQTQTTRKNKAGRQSITLKKAGTGASTTLDDYAHAAARALEKVRIEHGKRRK